MSALDSSLATLVVKATLILVAVLAAHLVLKRSSAATRHFVLSLATCGLVALPLLALTMPVWELQVLPQALAASPSTVAPAASGDDWVVGDTSGAIPAVNSSLPPTRASVAGAAERTWRFDLARALYGAWAVGAVLVLVRLLVGFLRLHRVVRDGSEATDPALLRNLEECRETLDLAARPRLVTSDRVEVPLVLGWLRPVLVVPTEFTGWSEDRIRAVLLHELGHVKRNDWPFLVLGRVVTAFYWFHPLVWYLERCARRECERACDDLVVTCGTRPSDYAGHLLSIARGVMGKPAGLAATLAVVRRSQLRSRLRSILDPVLRRNAPSRTAIAGLSTTLMLVLLPVASLQFAEQARADEPGKPDEILLAQFSNQEPSKETSEGADYSKKAYQLHKLGRYEEAIELWQEALDRSYKPGATTYNIACCHALLGDPVAAMEWLDRAIEAGYDDPRALVKDSDFDPIRSDSGFQEFIDAAFRSAGIERTYPQDYPYRVVLEKFEELRATNSGEAKMWATIGHKLLSYGELNRSVEAYSRAIELSDGGDTTAMYNLACAYSLAGRTGAALDWLSRAVDAGFDSQERFENDTDLENLRGSPEFERIAARSEFLSLKRFQHGHGGASDDSRERWAPAVEEYREFVSENPSHGRAWFDLGYALHGSGRFDEAIEAFGNAARLGYHPSTTNFNIACGYAMLGRTDAALDLLEAGVESGGIHYGQLESDSDLDSLREEPRFQALLEQLEGQKQEYEKKMQFEMKQKQQMHFEMKQKQQELQELEEQKELQKQKKHVSSS